MNLNRSIAPATFPITSIQLPEVEVISLKNGARLHCLFSNQQPIIKLEIVFKAGKWYETQKGVSYLTSKLLLEGTINHKASQIADIIAFYGASLECNHGFDRASLTLYCLSNHYLDILPLIQEILTESIFPKNELDLLKKRTIQNIIVEKQKNSFLATSLLTQHVYGPSHPYVSGMEESDIENVKRSYITEFFRSCYNLSEAEIFLAGDLNRNILSETQDRLGNIESELISKEVKIRLAKTNDKTSFLEKPEKLQSSIRIGSSLPLMQHPEFPNISLVNKILGGYFGSRLMKNIREEKGFTYGIFSALSPKENDTLFYIGTDVNYQNTDETIFEIKKELNILAEALVSEDELNTVKTYIIGKFVNDTSTIFDQSDKYKTLILHNLPDNHYSNYLSIIQNTSAEEVQATASKYFIEDNLHVVVVGKK